jgi:predicted RNase H-like nuclease (RuvC/YqgF family)
MTISKFSLPFSSHSCKKNLSEYEQSLQDKNNSLRTAIKQHKEVLSVLLEKHSSNIILKKLEGTAHSLEAINRGIDSDNLSLLLQLSKYKKKMEVEEENYNQEIDRLENENFILTNQLEKQNNLIEGYEVKLNEMKKRPNHKAMTEKFVFDPTQQILILQQELQASRNGFKKLSKELNVKLNKNEKLEQYSKDLQKQNTSLINIIKGLCENSEKQTTNCINALLHIAEGKSTIDIEQIKSIILGEPGTDIVASEEIHKESPEEEEVVKPAAKKSKYVIPTLDFSKLEIGDIKIPKN